MNIEALRLALEALENYQGFIDDAHILEGQWHWIDGASNAIPALRQAIEQAQKQPDLDAICQDLQEKTYAQAMRIAELEQAQPEIKQSAERVEPVAWRKFHEWMVRNMPGGTIISDPSWWAHHIYERFIRDKSPPQRQPLEVKFEADAASITPRYHVETPLGWVAAYNKAAIEYLVANGIGKREA